MGLTLQSRMGKPLAWLGLQALANQPSLNAYFGFDPTNGEVKIDGHPIQNFDVKTLRQQIALVSQDIYLFHGTIRENIAYGLPDDTPIDAIEHAAKMAELHTFIASTPNGYDSMIGERGIKLSGGQRQRLSIARAILKQAPIMIFDEATSSVDTETEAAIQRNLKQLTQGKTALIIAHRLSTIRNADQIIVLNNGKITEADTHDNLLKSNGDYATLWAIQTGGLTN